MLVVKADGSLVNLDKYEKIEVRNAFGTLGLLVGSKNYLVMATLSLPGIFANRAERAILGIYDDKSRAIEVRDILIKDWCDNNTTFIMPKGSFD